MDEDTRTFCPVSGKYCQLDACAWYDDENEACAMLLVSYSLYDLTRNR